MRRSLLIAAMSALSLAAAQNSLETLMEKTANARGGLRQLESMQTLRASGTLGENGREKKFVFYAQTPSRSRFEVEFGGRTTIYGFDGENAWVRSDSEASRQISPSQLYPAMHLLDPRAPFWGRYKDAEQRETMAVEELSEGPAEKVRIVLEGEETLWWIDAKSGQVRRARSSLAGEDGELRHRDVYFFEYCAREDLSLPCAGEVEFDGFATATVTVEELELGVELQEDFFRAPG